jgi:hypothetical protein
MFVKEKDKKEDKSFTGGWQMALSDARRRLHESKEQSRLLEQSIQIIQSKISAGDPWPGTTQN